MGATPCTEPAQQTHTCKWPGKCPPLGGQTSSRSGSCPPCVDRGQRTGWTCSRTDGSGRAAPVLVEQSLPDGVRDVVPERVDGLRLVDDHVVERLGAAFGQVEVRHIGAAVRGCFRQRTSHSTHTQHTWRLTDAPHLCHHTSPPPGSRCPPGCPAASPPRPHWCPAPGLFAGRSGAPGTSTGGQTLPAHRRKRSPVAKSSISSTWLPAFRPLLVQTLL